jgi:hypothetical protein
MTGALWQRGRDTINGGQHFTHDLAIGLVLAWLKSPGGRLRVGGNAVEATNAVIKGSGHFGVVLGAPLVGAGEEAEDVAVKIFLGRDPQAAFEDELKNLQMLSATISPAAPVVRLVGKVEAGVGRSLPWPAVVITPLCVESLEQRIDRFDQEAYTLQEAVAWAVQVALSLHCLHRESGLRHGDGRDAAERAAGARRAGLPGRRGRCRAQQSLWAPS